MSKTNYQLVCGLEVHAELKTQSKMFCACKNDPFGASKPNIHTCPVCLGMPGALPLANKKAIEWTIKIGLALNCKINLFSKFDRKNYFYPDLPKGYQISQYDIPFCYDGWLDTSEGRVGIHRIHLEEDTAKLIHQDNQTLIDFNRSGVPLVEIVTETDIKTATQAKEYGQKLKQILQYLEVADCDMEKGGMRLEANISLKKDTDPEGFLPDYKVECKNINSFKFMETAINYEMDRQAKMLDQDKTPQQETRGFNAQLGKTFSQRSKEEAQDYRYFPDPDLPPLEFKQEEIEEIRKSLVELPDHYAQRLSQEFDLDLALSKRLVKNKTKAKFFEKLMIAAKKENLNSQKLINKLINKKIKFEFTESIEDVLEKFKKSLTNEKIDQLELQKIIQEVLQNNQDAVDKYKSGKIAVFGFLIGQVTKKINKKTDIKQIKETLKTILDQ